MRGASQANGQSPSGTAAAPGAAQGAAAHTPETAQERHARRVAWGHEWAQVMREHSEKIKAREGRT